MKLRIFLAAGAAVLLAASGAAHAAVIGFDDIPDHSVGGDAPIVSPYDGFNWNDVYVASAADGPGFSAGIVSPNHDAYNGFNAVASFSTVSGTFTLNSLYLTAAFGPELVDFNAYLGGVLQHSVSLSATDSGPTFYVLDWANIDTVTFQGEDGHAAIDDISVNAQGGVPEPAAWALMIGGFGLTGAALRRRRQVAVAA
jgi:hypothetical protein